MIERLDKLEEEVFSLRNHAEQESYAKATKKQPKSVETKMFKLLEGKVYLLSTL